MASSVETLCAWFQRLVATRGDAPALTAAGHPGLSRDEYDADVARLTPGPASGELWRQLRPDVIARTYADQIEELYR